jgi:hypothetical protein
MIVRFFSNHYIISTNRKYKINSLYRDMNQGDITVFFGIGGANVIKIQLPGMRRLKNIDKSSEIV